MPGTAHEALMLRRSSRKHCDVCDVRGFIYLACIVVFNVLCKPQCYDAIYFNVDYHIILLSKNVTHLNLVPQIFMLAPDCFSMFLYQ